MKILYAYICSTELREMLEKTLALQEELSSEKFEDRVCFSDSQCPGFPIPVIDTGIIPFNYAKYKNFVFKVAQERSYDYIVMLGSDTLVAKQPTEFPASGFAASRTLFIQQDEDVKNFFKDGKLDAPVERIIDSSFYVIGKDVFTKFPANEDFICLCHHEDWEWHMRLQRAGIMQTYCNHLIVHLWHPVRVSVEEFKANKRTYEKLVGK